MVGLLVIIVAAAIGAGLFAALHHNGRSGHKSFISSADISPVIRNGAATWVATQVAARDIVACDPVMCRALQTHRMATNRLRVLWPGTNNLAGCAVIVATPAVRGDLGARLDSVYAPGIIARFGSGDRQIEIRAIAPHGAAAYRSDLRSDLAARKASGTVFAGNPLIPLSATEKKQLSEGRVDSRLMIIVAAIEAKHPVQVVAFGDASPGAASAPLRSADLAVTGNVSKQSMLAVLDAEAARDPEYQPMRVGTVRTPTGKNLLRIEFSAPSVLGVFGE